MRRNHPVTGVVQRAMCPITRDRLGSRRRMAECRPTSGHHGGLDQQRWSVSAAEATAYRPTLDHGPGISHSLCKTGSVRTAVRTIRPRKPETSGLRRSPAVTLGPVKALVRGHRGQFRTPLASCGKPGDGHYGSEGWVRSLPAQHKCRPSRTAFFETCSNVGVTFRTRRPLPAGSRWRCLHRSREWCRIRPGSSGSR